MWFGKKYIGQKKLVGYEANVNSGCCNAWILCTALSFSCLMPLTPINLIIIVVPSFPIWFFGIFKNTCRSFSCQRFLLKGKWKRCWWFYTFIEFIWLQLNYVKIQYLAKLPLCILCMAEHSRQETTRSNLVYLKQ